MFAILRRRLFLACAALFALSAAWRSGVGAERAGQTATAESGIDPAVLKAFHWRSIGPRRGGRSIAVSGVKGRPKEAYFGAVGGGLWKTVDGARTWTRGTGGQLKGRWGCAVAVLEA